MLSQTQPGPLFAQRELSHTCPYPAPLHSRAGWQTPLILFPVIPPTELQGSTSSRSSSPVESSFKTGATSSDSTTRAVVTSQEPTSAVRPVASNVRRSFLVKSSSGWSAAASLVSTAHPETTTAKTRPRPTLATASKFVTLSPVLVFHVSLFRNLRRDITKPVMCNLLHSI